MTMSAPTQGYVDDNGRFVDLNGNPVNSPAGGAGPTSGGPLSNIITIRPDGTAVDGNGNPVALPRDNTAGPGTYTRNPDGSLSSQRTLTPEEQDAMDRQLNQGKYAPTSSYGTGAGQYAPMSSADPSGRVTDPRLGLNYSGQAYDPWSYGGNAGTYRNGQYVPGSNGFDQRSGQYNSIASQAAYDASTGDTRSALALEKDAAMGNAPSQAEILGRLQLDESLNREQSLAASARGGALNQFAALEQASRNGAGERQSGLAAIEAMRAKEMADARGQYAGTATTMSAQQLQAELANRQRQLAAMGQADAIQQMGMASAQAKAQLVTGQATQTSIAGQQADTAKDIASRQSDGSLRNTIIGGSLAAGGVLAAGAASSLFSKPTAPAPVGSSAPMGGTVGGNTGTVSGPPDPNAGMNYRGDGAWDPNGGDNPVSDMRAKDGVEDLSAHHASGLAAQIADLRKQLEAQRAVIQGGGSSTDAALDRFGGAAPPMRLTSSTAGERSGAGGPWERAASDYDGLSHRADLMAQSIAGQQQAAQLAPSATAGALRDDIVSDDRAKQDFYALGFQHGSGTNAFGARPALNGGTMAFSPPPSAGSLSYGGVRPPMGGVMTATPAPNPGGSMQMGAFGRRRFSFGGDGDGDGTILSDARAKEEARLQGRQDALKEFTEWAQSPPEELKRTNSPIAQAVRQVKAGAWNEGSAASNGEMIDRRMRDIDRRVKRGEAVPVTDDEALMQLSDPRTAPSQPVVQPGGLAATVAAPRRAVPQEQVDASEEKPEDQYTRAPTSYGYATPVLQPLPGKVRAGSGQIVSDERAKTSLADEPMAKANRALKPSAYSYRPEFTPPDQEPGERNVGPMAQTMAADPVAGTAVVQKPNGLLALNRDKLAKLTAGGVGYLQERVDEQEKQLEMLRKRLAMKGTG